MGMACETQGAGAPDYFPCRYGQSRLMFRGPWRAACAGHAVALGGSLTYGRYVARPWPALLEEATGRMVLNLGVPHAGPDAWLNDPDLLRMAAAADLRILQVPGAVNLSNRFYTVHPRRNDRFLRASPALRRLYPDVDFTEFAFTRHMLRALASRGANRFGAVAAALADAWLDRMGLVLAALRGPTVLVWIADRTPDVSGACWPGLSDGAPMLVDARMLAALRPQVAGLVEVVVPEWADGIEGKLFPALEEPAARVTPGPRVHRAVADAMGPLLARH
jgi:Domain of unknown function (DUF6473)